MMRIQELVIVNNGTADARARLVRVAVLVSGTGLVDVVFCSMEIAGDRPSIESTSGFFIKSTN